MASFAKDARQSLYKRALTYTKTSLPTRHRLEGLRRLLHCKWQKRTLHFCHAQYRAGRSKCKPQSGQNTVRRRAHPPGWGIDAIHFAYSNMESSGESLSASYDTYTLSPCHFPAIEVAGKVAADFPAGKSNLFAQQEPLQSGENTSSATHPAEGAGVMGATACSNAIATFA